MFCHVCGLQVQEGAQFCTRCGARLSSATGAAAPVPSAPGAAPAPAGMLPASGGKRFANYLVDIVGVYLFGLLLGFIAGLLYAAVTGSSDVSPISVPLTVSGFFTTLLYYLFFESIWQRTPGKWVTGTKVVMRDGSKPPFKNTLGRSAARYIPFEAFSFLVSGYPVGWHDRLSGTLVVPAAYSAADVQTIDFAASKRTRASVIAVILIAVVVAIFIVGLLASVVLASLGYAREKGRDAARLADIRQLQTGLELYFADHKSYPESLDALAPDYLASVPVDPGTDVPYDYYRCAADSYHLGATLELAADLSMGTSAQQGARCAGDPIRGSAAQPCVQSEAGAACFDVTSQS